MHYCTQCNTQIEEHFKFCPSCGSLQKGNQPVQEVVSEKEILVKICEQCGEENAAETGYCTACGVSLALVAASTVVRKEVMPVKQAEPAKPVVRKAPDERKKNPQPKVESKAREEKKQDASKSTILLGISLLVLVAAVLIASGVFQSPKSEGESPVSQQTAPQQKTVDLNAVNELNELENRVKAQPENLEQMLMLAHSLNDAGFFDRAISYYKQYLGKKPGSPEVIIDMGVCYFNLKQFEKADSIMRTALKLAPNHPIGLYNLGIVNMAAGNMQEAKKWFNLVMEKHPGSQQAEQAKQILESHKIN